jgi:hypothetical protein
MNHRTILKSLALLLTLSGVALAGCYKEAGVDRNWGKSNHSNFGKMVADPDAPASLDTPVGLDPATAEGVMTHHRKAGTSERQPPQMAPSIIEIGGGS